jgi:hypothetical protein
MKGRMSLRPSLLPLAFAVFALSACSDPAGGASSPEDPATVDPAEGAESSASELSTSGCRGISGTDVVHYRPSDPNVSRELVASLAPSFVVNGAAFIPGVLRSTHSTSPYAYAATLELGAWSSMSMQPFGGTPDGNVYVWVGGSTREDPKGYKASKAIYNAMTNAVQTSESGAIVRRSSKGSVTCAKYTDSYQCVLGPFGHIRQSSVCPN